MAEKKAVEAVVMGRKGELTEVAADRNWRSYVDNELKCQEMWNQDWGFLAGGSKGESGKFTG
jgi:hypothetical protein